MVSDGSVSFLSEFSDKQDTEPSPVFSLVISECFDIMIYVGIYTGRRKGPYNPTNTNEKGIRNVH